MVESLVGYYNCAAYVNIAQFFGNLGIPVFRPVAIFIGLRYTRAKRRNHFISFISLASMLSIALGVTVLITVLSVMNGFDEQIRSRIFGMAEQVTATSVGSTLANWQALQKNLEKRAEILAAAPFVAGTGILTHLGQVQPALIKGILPEQENKVSILGQKMTQGYLQDLQANRFNVVLGEQLAANLGLQVGDRVTVLIPQASISPLGIMPRFKRFTVSGIFTIGNGVGYDSNVAFIHLQDGQRLFQLGDLVSGLRLKLKNLYTAPGESQQLGEAFAGQYIFSNWTDQYGSLFQAIKMEKTMIFFILLLIIAVAAFNLVSTLVMVVTEKQADIAILRTLGASPRMIMAVFMVQGTVIGLIGTLLGLIGGIELALHATYLVAWIEKSFHVQLLTSNVYYVNYLPSKLEVKDVMKICTASLSMSLLATLYPAWRAAKVQPAEALRYE